MISSAAADLRRYPASAAAYLLDGLPPNPQWGIKSNVSMPQDRLKATMAHLAAQGPRRLLRRRSGDEPRRRYQAPAALLSSRRPQAIPRASAPGAGDSLSRRQGACDARTHRRSTLSRTLRLAAGKSQALRGGDRMPAAYFAYARRLQAAYRERLKDMGDEDGRRSLGAEALAPACTTHFSRSTATATWRR
jgi:gamma-glutamyltranspeptidase/glutathione hydrolase